MSKYLTFLLTLSLVACSIVYPNQTVVTTPTVHQTKGTAPVVQIVSTPTSPFPHTTVDSSTMVHKLMMGYQGWFSCPDDGSQLGRFVHWFKGDQPTAANLRVDMWPDASELTPEEYCKTYMYYPNGQPAYLYSAYNPVTVMRHFEWMSQYGVDGVFIQRFGAILSDPAIFDQRNVVTRNVQAGAETYGRVFANMYDVSGMDGTTLISILGNDWKYMVDVLKVTESPSYLRHNGKPVLAIWGLGFIDESVTPAEALSLVEFFVNNPEPRYRVTLMGGVPTSWRTLQNDSHSDPAWMDYYCSLDVISPWTVGRFSEFLGIDLYKATMQKDLEVAAACGAEYMPVIFPGTAFHNDSGAPFNSIPRMGGKFYWRQVYNAISIDAPMLYNAMYDEVDEATAMFKIAATSADQPVGVDLIAMDTDGYLLPSDWYLRLAGSATQMLRGEIPLTEQIPISSGTEALPIHAEAIPIRIQLLTTSDWSTWTVQAGGSLTDQTLVFSSPEITDIRSYGNGFTIVQPIDRANSGASVVLIVDALLIDWQPGIPLQLMIESGAIGYTTITLYDASREPPAEIDSTTHYETKLLYEVSTDLFPSP